MAGKTSLVFDTHANNFVSLAYAELHRLGVGRSFEKVFKNDNDAAERRQHYLSTHGPSQQTIQSNHQLNHQLNHELSHAADHQEKRQVNVEANIQAFKMYENYLNSRQPKN